MCCSSNHKQNIDLVTFITIAVLSVVGVGGCLAGSFLDDNPRNQAMYWSTITGILGWWSKSPGTIVPHLSDLFVRKPPEVAPEVAIV